MTFSAMLPGPFDKTPDALPAVLVAALGRYLDVITMRLGAPVRPFADTLLDAERLGEVLGERDFSARVPAVADRLATITAGLGLAARPGREVTVDAVWLLMSLGEMQGWTSGWLGHRS